MTEAEFIEKIENYIENNESRGHLDDSCFSPSFYKKRKTAYNEAKKFKEAKAFYFGNTGYRSYFYFKSKIGKMYLIEIYLNEIDDYSYIE